MFTFRVTETINNLIARRRTPLARFCMRSHVAHLFVERTKNRPIRPVCRVNRVVLIIAAEHIGSDR